MRKLVYIVCWLLILIGFTSCDLFQGNTTTPPVPLPYIELVAGTDANKNAFITNNTVTLDRTGYQCNNIPFTFRLEVVSPQNIQALEITRNKTVDLEGTQELVYFAASGYTVAPYIGSAMAGGTLVTTPGFTTIAPLGQQFSSTYLTTSTGFTFYTRDGMNGNYTYSGIEKYTFTVIDQYGRSVSSYLTLNYDGESASCFEGGRLQKP
jgi:hypothetical protein